MTAQELLKSSSLPAGESLTLLSSVLNKKPEYLLAHPDTQISDKSAREIRLLFKKRALSWPIAYLIGQKGFYGREFSVNRSTLIPRPETEIIVEEILNFYKNNKTGSSIIDLGTGSGVIIISILKELAKNHQPSWPPALAVDISAAALKIAEQNAKKFGLDKRIQFFKGDLLKPVLKNLADRPLIIAANLPYLTETQIKNSPSIKREPRLALYGGPDGLRYYRRLFKQISDISLKSAFIICEIDPGQTTAIKRLTQEILPASLIEIKKDLRRKNRFAVIKLLKPIR